MAHDGAVAMLLRLPDDNAGGTGLSLGWTPHGETDDPPRDAIADPAMEVLKLLLNGTGTFVLDTGRLVWTWKARHGAD